MKSNLRLIVLVSLFCLFLSGAYAKQPGSGSGQGPDLYLPSSDVTISMDFQDASLKDILKIFSIQSGLNFIASEGVQDRKITLFFDKTPAREAMDKLFKANNLSYELDEDSSIFIVKDWGKPEVETITKVFYLKHQSVPGSNLRKELGDKLATKIGDIKATLEGSSILSSHGKITEDASTNSLIITDTPSRFPVIEQIIAKLDISVPQVLIDVEMLDVSKNIVDQLGFEFDATPFTLMLPGGFARRGAQSFFGNVTYRAASEINSTNAGAVVFGNTYAQILNFLRTQTDTKYLARPRLLTLNNETAEIAITKDEVVEVKPTTETVTPTGGGSPVTTVTGVECKRASEFKLTPKGIGITLRVTPQINLETNEVTMVINPQASTSTDSARAAAYSYVLGGQTYKASAGEPEIRETKSIVKVRDGETVILGGLIHTDKTEAVKKLPILGDIPLLGALFRNKNKTKDFERELLVFITPHILKEKGTGLAQQFKKATIPSREQSAASAAALSSRKIAVNASLDTFEKIK